MLSTVRCGVVAGRFYGQYFGTSFFTKEDNDNYIYNYLINTYLDQT
jgi:hypothetical protein